MSDRDLLGELRDSLLEWHVAYADRPGVFVKGRATAIRYAKDTGAQFVQERGGERRIVWEAL